MPGSPGQPGASAPFLARLPWPLCRALLHASVGKQSLAAAAGLALDLAPGQATPDDRLHLTGLGRDLLLAAWECDPLDGTLAARVLAVPGLSPLPGPLAALLAAVAAAFRPPADLTYFARLAARRDFPKILRYLEGQRAKEPDNLFWLSHRLGHDLASADYAACLALIQSGLPDVLAPVAPKLAADACLCLGDSQSALEHAREAARFFPGPGAAFVQARSLDRLRRRDEAALVLAELETASPWCAAATLLRYDRASAAAEPALLPGPATALLYTFNKAAEIAVTLESLEKSLADPSCAALRHVLVLDNGSSDNSLEVIRAFAERIGGDRLIPIALPVNVGAPAARNWLKDRPEARDAAFVAYMDDDVSLPANWLGLLARAQAYRPGAGVYGCKVIDHLSPLEMQSADLHLSAVETGTGDQPGRVFELSDGHHQVLDFGQFDYLRPCASVTGCLHLFAAGELYAAGDFDLRFSPSQYDDLDHDLRRLLQGKPAVYQGHLSLPHFKRTGRAGGVGGAQWSTGFANQYKLHGKYSPEQVAAMAETADRAALTDYRDKWAALHER